MILDLDRRARRSARRRARQSACRLAEAWGGPATEQIIDSTGEALSDAFRLEHSLTLGVVDHDGGLVGLVVETTPGDSDLYGYPAIDLDQTWLNAIYTPEALAAHRAGIGEGGVTE